MTRVIFGFLIGLGMALIFSAAAQEPRPLPHAGQNSDETGTVFVVAYPMMCVNGPISKDQIKELSQ